jgi:hypothetical protein
VPFDEQGRMWQNRRFWTQATYVMDRNLMGLSWEEREEMENASEYYGDLARCIHYRSTNTEKTLWDERIIMIPLKNEASDMDTATWERHAQTSVQVRYGDIRVSIVAGEMVYSTPKMFLPCVDQYTEWELALFREPGRTLDALTGDDLGRRERRAAAIGVDLPVWRRTQLRLRETTLGAYRTKHPSGEFRPSPKRGDRAIRSRRGHRVARATVGGAAEYEHPAW